MPYYCTDGNKTGSFWIPLDNVDKENNLQLILRSHKWPKLVRPTKWSTDKSWYNEDSSFMNLPEINDYKQDILIPELNLGDAVLFNFKIVHGSENAFGALPSTNNNSSQGSSLSSDPIDQSLHPLVQNTIRSNTIIGIMISLSMKTAFIRTLTGDEYFVRIGDKLGNANGSITGINYEGIEVTEDSNVTSLPVRNRSVSNANSE